MCFETIHFMNLLKYFYYLNLMLPKEIVNLILQHLVLKYKSENIKEIKRKINIFKVMVQEDDEIVAAATLAEIQSRFPLSH